MAAITLSGWPSGATVSAYSLPSIPSNTPDTDALGSAVTSAVASSAGTVTLVNLAEGARYIASDGSRRVRFLVPAAALDPATFGAPLAAGEETISRLILNSAIALSSQSVRLAYFTARKTEPITKIRVQGHTTAAAATPTLIRFGVYAEAANGGLSLVTATVNDTTLLATPSVETEKALAQTWSKVAGQRYALAALCVTGVAAPTVHGVAGGLASEAARAPRTCASVTGQSDLPASVAAGSLTAGTQLPYMVAVP